MVVAAFQWQQMVVAAVEVGSRWRVAGECNWGAAVEAGSSKWKQGGFYCCEVEAAV